MDELQIFDKIAKAKKRYSEQKGVAKTRKIEWLFTFETWWQMWQDSGKWEQRGNRKDQYCMARFKDIGPYSPENVEIILATQNNKDAHANGRVRYSIGRKHTPEEIEKMRIASTGVKQSDETRKKKSEANKGKPWSEARRAVHKQAWNKGVKQSDETRKKKSEANKGKPWSEARRAAHKQAWNKGLKGIKSLS